jgi:hypothetical protein
MALRPSDPWYTPPPAGGLSAPEDAAQRLRHQRALRLSQFAAGRGSRDAAYRQRCLDNWRAYIDGEI